jgi:site-specific recombinase XerD
MSGRLEKEMQAEAKMQTKLKELVPIFTEYYTSLRASRKSYMTINVYINNILHFANFITNNNISDDFYKNITSMDVERYIISLETRQTKEGIKRTGDDILQARWSALNAFFSWLVKRGHIESNPIITVDRPKNQVEHKVNYLSKTEINKLFKVIDKNPNTVIAMRDRTVISLALATALRVSALVNINIEDIDFDAGVIKVIEKRQKVREINIGENTQNMLKEWINIRNKEFEDINTNALFLSQKRGRLSGDAVGDLLTKYCSEAGIKRITPHKLRASAACALAKNNIPVKAIAKQLGHNNIATTMRYIDVFNEDSEKSKNILDNLF